MLERETPKKVYSNLNYTTLRIVIAFQNIDTLERVAGIPEEKLVEAHGSFHTAHCVDCRKEYTHKWVKGIPIYIYQPFTMQVLKNI